MAVQANLSLTWSQTPKTGFLVTGSVMELEEGPYYRNDPKFSDRYAWANSADPDQTAPRGVI